MTLSGLNIPLRRWIAACLMAGLMVPAGIGSISAQTLAPGYDFTPRDRRLQALFDQASRELQQQDADHREAFRSLQQLIDDGEDVFIDATMSVSLREQTLLLIASLPEATRKLYEETFGLEAASLLAAAESGSRELRLDVVRRFFHTAAGAEAAYQIAVTEMDAGRLLSAARMFDRLLSVHNDAPRFEPALSTRCILCYWQSGEVNRAAQILLDAAGSRIGFTLAGRNVPVLGSAQLAISWLTDTLGAAPAVSGAESPDWHLPQGTASRNASVAPVSPLFDDAWSVPLIRDKDADEPAQVEELATMLEGVVAAARERELPLLPVLTPLIVGDLVVFPSYGLVKAVDLESGELRWVALPADHTFVDAQSHATGSGNVHLSTDMEEFLAQRAWLDATSSQVSADGERVYFVRDSGMIGGLPSQFSTIAQANHPRRAKSFNALRAYDAFGGRWQWEIGGARARASLPLAGTFFLGPPLPVDGTLYVLGEDLGQVRLHALAPESGDVLWSLPLANAESDIEEDLDRRLAGLSPTLAGGLLICPTGSGLIVAVDPKTRSLSWGVRYREPQSFSPSQFRRGPFMGGFQTARAEQVTVDELLKQRTWHDACVIAAGSSVLVAPPDAADADDERPLICLSALDGEVQWKRARDESLFVGGVHEGTILLIGSRHAEGVSLTGGRTLWTLPLDRPGGRGVRSGALYHLPLADGEIATLDITTGALLARSSVRSGGSLGNFIASGGRLISLTATEVRSFRTLLDVEEQIARDLTADADNPAALAVRGESRLHAGATEAGLDDLRAVVAAADDQRARRLLVTTLLEGLRSDFTAFRPHVDELDRLATDPALRSRFLLTYAEGLLAAGETQEAFEQYLRLLAMMDTEQPFEYVGDGRWVRRDRRVLGQLARLHAAADDVARERFDKMIDAQLTAGSDSDQQSLQLQLASSVPRLRKAEPARVAPGEFDSATSALRAEAEFLRERRRGAPEEQAVIAAQLVTLYARHGRGEPMLQLLDELETVYGGQPCLDGKTGAEWAASARESAEVAAVLGETRHWPTGEISIREGAANSTPFVPLSSEGPIDPLVSTFLFLPNNRGLVAIQDGHGVQIPQGILKLQPASREALQSQYVMQQGHRAVVFLGTQFQLVDLMVGPPRVLLQDLLVDVTPADAAGLRFQQRSVRRHPGFRGNVLWSEDPGENGSVGPLNDSVFCYLRGTTLHAHDPFTGERFWSVEDAPHGSEIFADRDYVLLVPIGRNRAHIYRALDGEPLAVRILPGDVVKDRRGADWGRYFLRRSVDGTEQKLAMYDPVTEENVWERPMDKPFTWAPRDGRDLCVVDDEGLLTLIDPETGDVQHEAQIDIPADAASINVLSLPDQWIVTTYRRAADEANATLAPVQLEQTAYALNGPATAFDRPSGEIMWTRVMTNQMVSPDMPARWPVLSLSAVVQAMPQLEGNRVVPVLTRRIELINRATGETEHLTSTDGRSRRLDVFWQVSDTVPQLRLRYGLMELEIAFGELPADEPPEPSPAAPPPPARPTTTPPEDAPPDENP